MKQRRSAEHQQAVLDLRRSSAAARHRSKKAYRRKPKNERDRQDNWER